jgi:hypothetical protein
MGAIDEFGSDVNSILADLNAQFGALNDAKAKLKQRGGDIAQRWAEYFQDQAKAIAAAEAALNKVSNVPLAASSPPSVTPVSQVPLASNPNAAISSLPRVAP